MYKPKDVFENFEVVRFLLKAHQLQVDEIEAFAGLREELAQQIIHGSRYFRRNPRPGHSEFGKWRQCVAKRFNFGCVQARNGLTSAVISGLDPASRCLPDLRLAGAVPISGKPAVRCNPSPLRKSGRANRQECAGMTPGAALTLTRR
jgi:hypothetical protein